MTGVHPIPGAIMPAIKGLAGLSPREIGTELENGARFRMYQYAISIVVMTFKRPSDIYFIRAGESAIVPGLKYSLLSFLVGWWGLPWGLIYTPWAIISNLSGGVDVTQAVLAELGAGAERQT